MTIKQLLIEFLLPGSPALAILVPLLIKLNSLENKGIDLIRKINNELTPLFLHEKYRLESKIQIALLKQRVNDIEGYLQKQGFVPSDIEEDSFL
jgi:hypothetical protein